jgi:hypothetical protein
MLRFARRARCPGCGGPRILSLHTEQGRAELRTPSGGALARAWLYWLALVAWFTRSTPKALIAPRVLTVHTPSSSPHGETLRGVVRLASVSLESPIDGTPCVVFGLHGDVNGAPIDDAEGGDFDLELESGERVMVSLEHAVLVDEAPKTPSITPATPYMAELLQHRGLEPAGTVRAAEVVVREGDVVTVEAEVSGGAALSFGERASSRVRVAAGDESNPLVVRL